MKCGVCGRPYNEVKQLVSLPRTVFQICDRCTIEAVAAIQAKIVTAPAEAEVEVLPFPKELKRHLDDYVISQEDAKKDLSIAIYNHYKRRMAASMDLGVELSKSNVLLMGPSGCGKTELIRAIANKLNVPLYVGDATRLTISGYVGDDVETLVRGLYLEASRDVAKTQWGIIFLDEADKMARTSGKKASGYRDISGEGVQQALLKMVEGSKVQIQQSVAAMGVMVPGSPVQINTENILFVFSGSFAGIEDIVQKRLVKSRIGFMAEGAKTRLEEHEIYPAVTEEDLLEFGIIPELLGRVPVRTYVNRLTEADMVNILTEPKNALVKQFKALFKMDQVELTFDPDALLEIGRQAASCEVGARALRGILERILKPYAYEIPGSDIREVRVTRDLV